MVRELSERARAAERALRLQRANAEAKKRPPVRVRASVQPTFVRFVFEMPDGVGVSSVLNEQKLTLLFNAPLTFDLADAKVAAPPNVASINQKIDGDTSMVEAELIGDVDVHSFREEKNYIVDVAFQQSEKPPVATPRASAAPPAPAQARRLRPRQPRRPSQAGSDPQPEPHAARDDAADLGDDCAAGQDRNQARDQAGDGRQSRAAASRRSAAQLPKEAPVAMAEGVKAGAAGHARAGDWKRRR